ncbi:hypothetical protein M0805_002755 [Coniferiporia weirii]|nr:hypothetical protein M0805_002755 [Coniferiporia weirii]
MNLSLRAAKQPWRLFECAKPLYISRARRLHQSGSAPAVDEVNGEGQERKHIHLTGLPLSATPSDVLRLAKQVLGKDDNVSNIASIKMDYHRFMPTGRAYIEMIHARHAENVAKRMRDSQMTTLQVKSYHAPVLRPPRMRGERGRAEAASRAVLEGNGMGGGVGAKAWDVVLWGIPGTMSAQALRYYLRRVELVGVNPNGEPKCEVLRVETQSRNYSFTSKHLVRLNSSTEAHALARRLHMTYFLPEVWQTTYLVRAKVVY